MESLNALQYLKDKTILVTGATGFLAKIFVEKILRIQPNVKKLYLLIRAEDTVSATQRMFRELIDKDLFRVLRETWGENLESFLSEKVAAVPGDVSFADMGIKDTVLKEEICGQIDLIVHTAAVTKFDGRYDALLGTNTMGAFHVLNFGKSCPKLETIIHVSTAYICGEKSGLLYEESFNMGETLNGQNNLDIKAEKKLAEEKLNELQAAQATEKEITSSMRDFGLERARLHGWPNTYVFSKAMGEMIIGQHKQNLTVVIIRPTMITSTYREPFPGWIEGLRTIDFPIVVYGKGKFNCVAANPQSTFDLIPADMVVNAMIMAMVAKANKQISQDQLIFHVGSSLRNPLQFFKIGKLTFLYFTKNPFTNKNGKPIIVKRFSILDSPAKFHRYLAIRYVLPLKGLKLVNLLLCGRFEDICNSSDGKIKLVKGVVNVFKPYMFFEGIFDDTNSEKLRRAMRESGISGLDAFDFDPQSIDWQHYFLKTHIPGLLKYAVE